ncbi:hypothetical protein A3N68_10855 [Enterobacter asburiae]|nr:hypothetical protein A3N68_10855 [Enterobacter asburiae]
MSLIQIQGLILSSPGQRPQTVVQRKLPLSLHLRYFVLMLNNKICCAWYVLAGIYLRIASLFFG